MTKRLSAGVVLVAFSVIFTAMNADAARPPTREWRGGEDPYASTLPLFFRSSAGTTWLAVGQNGTPGCNAADTTDSNHSTSQVWCFDRGGLPGAPADSIWPSRGSQGSGNWNHYSGNVPPVPLASKWHITTRNVGATQGGTYAAWVGCDSLGTNPNCPDVCFWTFKEGYADDWEFPLVLDMVGQDASAGGMIEFDIFYDSECNYDYTFLEYFNTTTDRWQTFPGSNTRLGIFNGVSGFPAVPTLARPCGTDYFQGSDQQTNALQYGNAQWKLNVTFPMPAQVDGMQLRWRSYSDGAWSDQDGSGDTDGICRIDNVTVTFTATGNTVNDNFESGDFDGLVVSAGTADWVRPPHSGLPFNGWNLVNAPQYKNKGNTCEFSNDWMWQSKPVANYPTDGTASTFTYFLVTPKIRCDGWTGGVLEYSGYLCAPDPRDDYTNTQVRLYDTACGKWSLWNDFDGYITFGGCEFWNMNDTEDLSPFLGSTVDSLQLCWQMLDFDRPTDLSWNNHANVNYLIDNVSIGNYDLSSTIFTTRAIDILSDTFSLVDQAHSAQVGNSEEGNWSLNGGTRAAGKGDSIGVRVSDVDGINNGDVSLHWRVGTGTPVTFPGAFGTWKTKLMVFSDPDATSPTDEGTYRGTFGNLTTEDYNAAEGPPDPIWTAGQTVEYYLRAEDVGNQVSVFPNTADDATPIYFRFQVLPFNRSAAPTGGIGNGPINLLLVDDYGRANLDFENSTGFQPTGGAGFGNFTSPVFEQPENLIERALAAIYGGSEDFVAGVYGAPEWDIYNVAGAGSSVQREPRISSEDALGLGGIADDFGGPRYEAVIWLQGSFDAYSYADTTRMDLKVFLDAGGKLFSSGDDVATFLGAIGTPGGADSTIGFLEEYFGIADLPAADDETLDRVLNVEGVAGTSLAGLKLGLYGDCPGIRHSFDKLNEATDTGAFTSTTIARYQQASPDGSTNGRGAIMKNVRTAGAGVAVHCGFAVESLVSLSARACLLSKVLTTDFGVPAAYSGCVNSGTDAPVVAAGRFGFDLAQATPNPFKDATSIRFSVPGRTHVSIEVYNILGQKVRTLVDETFESNSYVREWDGRADTGTAVSSGIYFYKMVAGDYTATRKAVVLK